MEKTCKTCGETKDKSFFRQWRRNCKVCDAALSLEYYRCHSSPEEKAKYAKRDKELRRLKPNLYLYNGAKVRAKKYKLEFNITPEDILIPDFCPVLGIKLFVGEKKWGPNSPTLDKIDNTKGYIKGNIKVISWRANSLKSDSTIEEIEKVLAYMKNPFEESDKINSIVEKQELPSPPAEIVI